MDFIHFQHKYIARIFKKVGTCPVNALFLQNYTSHPHSSLKISLSTDLCFFCCPFEELPLNFSVQICDGDNYDS